MKVKKGSDGDFQGAPARTRLTLREYQSLARTTDQRPDGGVDLSFPLLGLFGEIGSLLSEAKKKQRDSSSYVSYTDSVVEEFGDVLWYWTDIATRSNLSIADLVSAKGPKSSKPLSEVSFASLQARHLSPKRRPTQAYERTLLHLASEVGLLVSSARTGKFIEGEVTLKDRLHSIFRALIVAANEAGITIEQAAIHNVEKILDRWPTERAYPPLFDNEDITEERLPRRLTIDIVERTVKGKTYVIQRCNGLNIGDRLTDNMVKSDDYRFHDVFHYAHAAVLGWSPTLRALLRLKRKSRPLIDESEDGARAILTEEAVANWVFGRAKELNFFADTKRSGLSFGLLKSVRQFVSGYEAGSCPLWLWEEAILQGYEAFRFLRQRRRARLHLDLEERRLSVGELHP